MTDKEPINDELQETADDADSSKPAECEPVVECEPTECKPAEDPERRAELAELEQLRAEREQLLDKAARAQADLDNYRRRARAEMESIGVFANESLIKSLLPVFDNFDRALAAAGNTDDPVISGVLLVKKQLAAALEKAGLKEIEAVGKPFDPNFHEAVMQAPADGVEDNTVIEELQKGYMLSNRVIRPSMVKVAKS